MASDKFGSNPVAPLYNATGRNPRDLDMGSTGKGLGSVGSSGAGGKDFGINTRPPKPGAGIGQDIVDMLNPMSFTNPLSRRYYQLPGPGETMKRRGGRRGASPASPASPVGAGDGTEGATSGTESSSGGFPAFNPVMNVDSFNNSNNDNSINKDNKGTISSDISGNAIGSPNSLNKTDSSMNQKVDINTTTPGTKPQSTKGKRVVTPEQQAARRSRDQQNRAGTRTPVARGPRQKPASGGIDISQTRTETQAPQASAAPSRTTNNYQFNTTGGNL